MDTDTGRIYNEEEIKKLRRNLRSVFYERFKDMKVDPTPVQLDRKPPRVGRNEPCPCGSNRKFKRCCFTGKE